MKVIPIVAHRELKWFFDNVYKPVYYYEDVEKLFRIVESKNFALGYSFICNKCNRIPLYIREDFSDLFQSWLVVHIICGCGVSYKIKSIKPIYQVIFEQWDISCKPEWIIREI